MSVEIWPPISPAELKIQEDATQDRELSWLLASLRDTIAQVKSGLEDCCALLSPPDSAGSTLALTTPRNETVKGHTTRIGTRLVRGVVHLRFRTLPPQTLTLDPSRPIHVAALTRLDTLLALSVGVCLELEEHENRPHPLSAPYLAAQLRLLAQHISEAAALVKGPPIPISHPRQSTPTSSLAPPPGSTSSRPTSSNSSTSTAGTINTASTRELHPPQLAPADTTWTTSSISLSHFTPPLSRNLSLYITIQEACLVIYLRALEPADAPMNFGAKLALAIGTTRRLEHDEADRLFTYRCCDASSYSDESSHSHSHPHPRPRPSPHSHSPNDPSPSPRTSSTSTRTNNHNTNTNTNKREIEVYVREKVRVESPDPSLLSLSAKLSALGNSLGLARRNLAAVMGDEMEDYY
ncbi:RAVE subunit 2/Rogdi [Hypoxylon fragiforme]|uniref:RAVE subunit 2/Rogdi n=1 Tax=Hypoxylon fragiforme TaxID=63214 RepID=UPI0020C65355|nr:RAVE subunit 2/Rogdi [Hypoxylon fragiforme]KAI2604839.1 RAVE subunit 2/Rogdi [Hypoxylon fragiforme]